MLLRLRSTSSAPKAYVLSPMPALISGLAFPKARRQTISAAIRPYCQAWSTASSTTNFPSVSVAFSPSTPDELVGALCALFEHSTTVNRTVTTARLVLFMEASHNEALREALSRGRAAMEALGVVALARLGAREPHTAGVAVAACFEGLLLHRIARHDPTDPRPTFELVVRAALA